MKPPLKIDPTGKLRELTPMEKMVRTVDSFAARWANMPEPEPRLTLMTPYEVAQNETIILHQ